MTKLYTKSVALLVFLIGFSTIALAQTTVSGTIKDAGTGDPIPGVNIIVIGTVTGTISNTKGEFSLNVNQSLPFTISLSYIGYATQEIEITENQASGLNIAMEEQTMLGQEVVVSASKIEENILQSPVSIEQIDLLAIQNTPSVDFYGALNNQKGIDITSSSLTFKTVNSRGFNSNGNTRMVQQIDGMDNQAPGLNFSVGNIVGIPDLDVESVEVLPGAASALYGPNALSGIILMNSKNPFNYQGVSGYVKTGVMSADNRSTATTGFYDFGVRYAKAVNDKFAFKINMSYLTADDWQATDYRDQSLLNGSSLDGTRASNTAYNGVNTYGDETNVNMYSSLYANGTPGDGSGGTSAALGAIATTPVGGQTIPQWTGKTPQEIFAQLFAAPQNTFVSRIGYEERDLADYRTKSFKTNLALHYRLSEKVEAILQGNYGSGTTVYTGADRYSLKDFYIYQIKAEVKGDNFYVRGYTTQERSGDAYAIGTLAQLVNEAWKPSTTWYPQYFGSYFYNAQSPANSAWGTYAGTFGAVLGQTGDPAQAEAAAMAAAQAGIGGFNDAARAVADVGRLVPGSDGFNSTVEALKKEAIPNGAKFVDRTNMYHVEGMYNFKNDIDFIELMVGGNYRIYDLNSNKTIFAVDENGDEYNINEFGGYVQVAKSLINDKLKLTGSIRYDKNENFDGQFSPRISGVFKVKPTHSIRASYQTGFRIPTMQDQYIDLNTPQAHLIGGLPFFRNEYDLVGNSYTLESYLANPTNPAEWTQYNFTEFRPERALVTEFGYKGVFANKLMVDAYYYTTTFKDFIGGQVLVVPSGTSPGTYSLPVNLEQDMKSHGWALGLDYSLPMGFNVSGNIAYNSLTNEDELPAGFQTQYNTPEYRYNISISRQQVSKKFGFNITWRYQDSYLWQSSFVGPNVRTQEQSIMPSFSTLDAQVSYKLKPIKSIIKVGANNLLNDPYVTNWGNPTVGGLYYISISFDEFLN